MLILQNCAVVWHSHVLGGPVCHHQEWKLEGYQNSEATVRRRETLLGVIGEESFVVWVADAEGTLKNKLESKRIGWQVWHSSSRVSCSYGLVALFT